MKAISAGSTVLLQTRPGSSKGFATFVYRLTNADRSVRALGTLSEGARRLNGLLKAKLVSGSTESYFSFKRAESP